MPNRELVYFLVCDFARVEAETRKGIFIGAYGTSIIAQGFPVVLPSLAFVACFKGLAPKERLSVTLQIPGMDEHLSTTQNVDTRADQEANTVMITISPCTLAAAGQISIDYRFEDGTSFRGSIDAKIGPKPQ